MDVITPIVDDRAGLRRDRGLQLASATSTRWVAGPRSPSPFSACPRRSSARRVVGEVLEGVHEVCDRARCAVVGGHTMKDSEPKCGSGGHRERRAGARLVAEDGPAPGDVLILTKPIGTGLGRAGRTRRQGRRPEALRLAVEHMSALNDASLRGGTRLTGPTPAPTSPASDCSGIFATSSRRRRSRPWSSTPRPSRCSQASSSWPRRGCVPGGSRRNLAFASKSSRCFDEGVGEAMRLVLADAQTSGGLVLVVPRRAQPTTHCATSTIAGNRRGGRYRSRRRGARARLSVRP